MKQKSAIEAAAAEFGRHTKAGVGWALGLAVAACVENNGPGRPKSSNRKISAKTTATEFARQAGTSAARVLRYLDAWEAAAVEGIVVNPVELTPDDWNDPDHLPEGYNWSDFYAVPAEDAGTRATPGNIGRQLADNPKLAEAAAEGLAAGAIRHVEKQTNRDLSRAVDDKITRDYGVKPKAKPKPRDDGEPGDEFWAEARKALYFLLDVQVKIAQGATAPADVEILMQILLPPNDWDQAASDLIGGHK